MPRFFLLKRSLANKNNQTFLPLGKLPILAPYSSHTFNIGLIRLSSIGDVILASACLNLLQRLALPVHVTWIGRKTTISLLAVAYPMVTFIAVEDVPSLRALSKKLHHLHLLVDLQRNARSFWLTRLFALRYRKPLALLKKSSLARGLMVVRALVAGRAPWNHPPSAASANLQYRKMTSCVLEALNKHFSPSVLEPLKSEVVAPALKLGSCKIGAEFTQFGNAEVWLAIAPGASFAAKRAPVGLLQGIFSELRKQLDTTRIKEHNLGLVLLGDKADQVICNELVTLLQWQGPLLNLAGKLSLSECGRVLTGVSVLLSNDSSLSHLAEAVGTPAVVLFGPTVEAFGFAPQLPQSRAFSHDLGCRPCSKHGKTPCRYGDYRCFLALPSSEVARYLSKFLPST